MKKLKWISIVSITIILFFILFYNLFGSNNIETITIGVPLKDNPYYRYDVLEADLENEFNINIEFIDIYPSTTQGELLTEEMVVDNICYLLENNEVDMLMGVPSQEVQKSINDGLLMDITDEIINIDSLHKGTVDASLKDGNGRMYYVSPIVENVYLVFQNDEIFDALNVEKLPLYVSWEEFLYTLGELDSAIETTNSNYYPIAYSVKNVNDEKLFIAPEFRMFGYGLDIPVYENGYYMKSEEWEQYYYYFATFVKQYGKGYEELENGIYPKNNIFANGEYAIMFATLSEVEMYLNEEYNTMYNKNSPTDIEADFDITVTFMPNLYGEPMQNMRTTVIAIDENTEHKSMCIDIMNYILSEEYAMKMIEVRNEYSHFSNAPFAYPAYYSQSTIDELNKSYNGKFDSSLIYNVEQGSRVYMSGDIAKFEAVVNQALTYVYYDDMTIEESFDYIDQELN